MMTDSAQKPLNSELWTLKWGTRTVKDRLVRFTTQNDCLDGIHGIIVLAGYNSGISCWMTPGVTVDVKRGPGFIWGEMEGEMEREGADSASTLGTPSKWQHPLLPSSEVMLQRFHPPSPSLFVSVPHWKAFGADIPTHHWSSYRTNGNPPAFWNYWWLSLSPPITTTFIPTPPPLVSHPFSAEGAEINCLLLFIFLCWFFLLSPHTLFLHLSFLQMLHCGYPLCRFAAIHSGDTAVLIQMCFVLRV